MSLETPVKATHLVSFSTDQTLVCLIVSFCLFETMHHREDHTGLRFPVSGGETPTPTELPAGYCSWGWQGLGWQGGTKGLG